MHPYLIENLSQTGAVLGYLALHQMKPEILEALHESEGTCDFSPGDGSGALILWKSTEGIRQSVKLAIQLAAQLRPESFCLLLFRAKKEALFDGKGIQAQIALANQHLATNGGGFDVLLAPELSHQISTDELVTWSHKIGDSWVERLIGDSTRSFTISRDFVPRSEPVSNSREEAVVARGNFRLSAVPGKAREFILVAT